MIAHELYPVKIVISLCDMSGVALASRLLLELYAWEPWLIERCKVTTRRILMSLQDMRESPLAGDDGSEGRATEPQPAPRRPEAADDDSMDNGGSSSEGNYREQDYGGEPTHPPIEAAAT